MFEKKKHAYIIIYMAKEARCSAVTPRPSALMPGSGTGYLAGSGVGADSQIEKNMACEAEQKQRRYPRRDRTVFLGVKQSAVLETCLQNHSAASSAQVVLLADFKNAFGKVWFKDVLRCFQRALKVYLGLMEGQWRTIGSTVTSRKTTEFIEAGFLSGKVVRVL